MQLNMVWTFCNNFHLRPTKQTTGLLRGGYYDVVAIEEIRVNALPYYKKRYANVTNEKTKWIITGDSR